MFPSWEKIKERELLLETQFIKKLPERIRTKGQGFGSDIYEEEKPT